MTGVTIRVRVNPVDNGEYVIYADPEDRTHPWSAQRPDGRWMGWERALRVADWPEFELALDLGAEGSRCLRHPGRTRITHADRPELTVPGRADPDPERPGSP